MRSEPGGASSEATGRAGESEAFVFTAQDRQATAVIATILAVLLANRYVGSLPDARWIVGGFDGIGLNGAARWFESIIDGFRHQQFNRRMYFATFRIVVYLVPALLICRLVLKRPVSAIGWRINARHLRMYAGLYLAMLPFVIFASRLDSFQEVYPFYRPNFWESVWPWFVVWELFYLLHFVALELFFRGFGVHGLFPRFGWMSVVIMVIPYVMIHFSKPFPEAIGSVVAGLVLGVLSVKSGSAFWGGVLHFAVALTMDLLTY